MNWMKRAYAWSQESGRNVAISLALCFVVLWVGFGLMQTPTTSAAASTTYRPRGIYMPWSPAPIIILPGGGFGGGGFGAPASPSSQPASPARSWGSSAAPSSPATGAGSTNRTDSPSWGSSSPSKPSISAPARTDAPSWGSSKAPSRSIGSRRR